LSSWAPFGPSSDDEGEEKKDQPLWSGEDPAPPQPEPTEAEAEPEPEPAPPAYEPPTPPPFESQPAMTPGDPLVGRATPPPGDLEWPPPAPPPSAYPEPGARKTPANATLSLVFGILGLLVCPVILSVAAIGTGMSAKRQIAGDPRLTGRGVAQTGIVLGAIGLAVWVVFFAIGLAGYLGLGSGL
jgi:hypothetical protein